MTQAESKRSKSSALPVVQEQPSFVTASEQGLFGSAPESPLFVPPVVQPKLSVSQPGDAFEQEADATGGATTSRVENVLVDLIKVLDNKVKMKNLGTLLSGLESNDKSMVKTAEFLVDEIARHKLFEKATLVPK